MIMQSLQSYLLTASAICEGNQSNTGVLMSAASLLLSSWTPEPCVKIRGGLLHVDGPELANSLATDPQVSANVLQKGR